MQGGSVSKAFVVKAEGLSSVPSVPSQLFPELNSFSISLEECVCYTHMLLPPPFQGSQFSNPPKWS